MATASFRGPKSLTKLIDRFLFAISDLAKIMISWSSMELSDYLHESPSFSIRSVGVGRGGVG